MHIVSFHIDVQISFWKDGGCLNASWLCTSRSRWITVPLHLCLYYQWKMSPPFDLHFFVNAGEICFHLPVIYVCRTCASRSAIKTFAFFLCFFLSVQYCGWNRRASCILGKCSTTELPQPRLLFSVELFLFSVLQISTFDYISEIFCNH